MGSVLYRRVLLLGLAAVFCVAQPARAEDIPAYKLQMQTDPKLPGGKIRIIEGEAGPGPDRFFLEGLGVLSPVAVTIIAKHKGDEIQVAFGQDRWDETIQKASTSAAKNEVTTKLRTQGDLKISVTASAEGKPYWLIVWVGDEVKAELAPVTVPMTKYKKEHPDAGKAPAPGAAAAGGTSPVMIVIAVALVAIVLLLAFMAFRKKGRS